MRLFTPFHSRIVCAAESQNAVPCYNGLTVLLEKEVTMEAEVLEIMRTMADKGAIIPPTVLAVAVEEIDRQAAEIEGRTKNLAALESLYDIALREVEQRNGIIEDLHKAYLILTGQATDVKETER